ncbi:terpene synthase family protein [Streptomyces mirabilis]|uniref:terpene synthase family protein n=1 Tax=Streptomyces mirabilis TaxID=68239 RepID=UPI00365ADBDD
MACLFVFDNQLDGPLGLAPDRVARVCQRLIDIVHGIGIGSGAGHGGDPCSTAFADLWRRSTNGAAPGWVARVAHDREFYLPAHAHEAVNRCRGCRWTWSTTSMSTGASPGRRCRCRRPNARRVSAHLRRSSTARS